VLLRRGNKQSQLSRSEAEAAHLDHLLDEALLETFPASDAIAITIDKRSKGHWAESHAVDRERF
jgi:hypothetical protein